MIKRLRPLLVLAVVFGLNALAANRQGENRHDYIHNDVLSAPKVASQKTGYADYGLLSESLPMGSLVVPFPAELPSARGAILHPVLPSYSHRSGLTEWGKGWDASLRIRRYSERGEVNCGGKSFLSPWGKLVLSDDGKTFYPKGLDLDLRVIESANGFTAFHPDGRVFRFSGNGWYLQEVLDKEGHATTFSYINNAFGRPLLTSVAFGGKKQKQYQVDIAYEKLAKPVVQFESCGKDATIGERISSVVIKHWDKTRFTPVKTHKLVHEFIDGGGSFYLSSVETLFATGAKLPATQFRYDGFQQYIEERYKPVNPEVRKALKGIRDKKFFSFSTAIADFNQDGILDFERANDLQSFIHGGNGSLTQGLKYWSRERDNRCEPSGRWRDDMRLFAFRRTLFRPSGLSSDLHQLLLLNKSEGHGTKSSFLVCSLSGQAVYEKEVYTPYDKGYFFDGKTHLIDINGDRKPDIVRLKNAQYIYFINESTDNEIRFADGIIKSLPFSAREHKSFLSSHLVDFNGDGYIDLVTKHKYEVYVWYGREGQEFDSTRHTLTLQTKIIPKVKLESSELTFVDINRDGLLDIVQNYARDIHIYINQGDRFFEFSNDIVLHRPFRYGFPRLVNFAGTPDDQLTMVGNLKGDFISLALNGPSTGLLTQIDNGQGVTVDFKYRWTKPQAGTPRLFVVPQSVSVRVPGIGEKTTKYEFGRPKIDFETEQFIGFESVEASDEQGVTKTSYSVDPNFLPKILSTETVDHRLPQIAHVLRQDWQEFMLAGVVGQRADRSETSYLVEGKNEFIGSVLNLDFERLCPKKTVAHTREGRVTTLVEYIKPAFWREHHSCISGNTTTTFAHTEKPQYDFVLGRYVIRNDVGLATSMGLTQKSGDIQETTLAYNSLFDLLSVKEAGSDESSLRYDPSFEIVRMLSKPDGTKTLLASYDPLSDSILGLNHVRSEGEAWSQKFGYDPAGRLAKIWDSVSDGSEDLPLLGYAYRYGNQTHPALVETNSKIAPNAYASVAELYFANGLQILKAQNSANGHFYHRSIQEEVSSSTRREVDASEISQVPVSLTYEQLNRISRVVSTVVNSNLWGVLSRTYAVDSKTLNTQSNSFAVSKGFLQTNGVENGGRQSQISSELAGKKSTRYVDELGRQYNYSRDLLGRIRSIKLPDGSEHTTSYDDAGRVLEQNRSAVGSVQYEYDNKNNRLRQKTFIDVNGAARQLLMSYDNAGRLQSRTFINDVETDEVNFDYRGELLIRVRHAQFVKNYEYTVDGKPKRVSIHEQNGSTLAQSLERDAYHRVIAQRTSLDGDEAQFYDKHYAYDSSGLLKSVQIGEQSFVLSRGKTGSVNRVSLSDGNELTIRYDPLTGGKKAHEWKVAGGSQVDAGYAWHYNNRGLVDESTFVWKGNAHSSTYEYNADKTLARYPATLTSKNSNWLIGANGRIKQLQGKRGLVDYVYDETGNRVAKYRNGSLDYLRLNDIVAANGHVYEKLTIEGIDIGILIDGRFTPGLFDQVGSLVSWRSKFSIGLPYGERENILEIHEYFDFAGHGRDKDTGLINMGARDYDPATHLFISPDLFILENPEQCISSPQQCDLYSYARGNPLKYIDPSGHVVDIILDVGFIGWDIYELYHEPSWWGVAALGADVVGAIIPGVTGLGRAIKGAEHGLTAVKAEQRAERIKKVETAASEVSKVIKEWKALDPEKTAYHEKFKVFYKNRHDGYWWSKDTAGHGGSEWKVFKEGNKGLEWLKDADKFGKYLEGKHKGEIGKLIPWDEIRMY